MLDHFGAPQAARAVENAIESVCEKGPHTPDFGGKATTQDMGKAIAAAV
jgi:tartrate dehydrogenase/decarboxylase/D-malate dehydrogenase